jgi:hypothetical protein
MLNRKAVTCLVVFAGIVIATVAVTTQAPMLTIAGVNVVDVVEGRILPDSTVVVSHAASRPTLCCWTRTRSTTSPMSVVFAP